MKTSSVDRVFGPASAKLIRPPVLDCEEHRRQAQTRHVRGQQHHGAELGLASQLRGGSYAALVQSFVLIAAVPTYLRHWIILDR